MKGCQAIVASSFVSSWSNTQRRTCHLEEAMSFEDSHLLPHEETFASLPDWPYSMMSPHRAWPDSGS
tara:strand:+ start:49 stop:249 length:201 start_codon:yes stop_codon:yes gene_type:complete